MVWYISFSALTDELLAISVEIFWLWNDGCGYYNTLTFKILRIMVNSRRQSSEINAGSMADIAFLLLIFFLVVSTMEKDVGINRKLPKWCPTNNCSIDLHARNLLTIELNAKNELLVNKEFISLNELKEKVISFVDNNGDATCTFCNGSQIPTASDNPKTAVISILSSRETNYQWFINVQDELVSAYFDLRKTYVEKKFNKPLSELTDDQLKQAKEAYPFQVSEAELKL